MAYLGRGSASITTSPVFNRALNAWSVTSARDAMWKAVGGNTTVNLIGFGNTISGTATSRTVAATNILTSTRRLGYVSAAAAGSAAGTRFGLNNFWRGNAANLGGFEYTTLFGTPTIAAGTRGFVGLNTAAIGNVEISTLTNLVGFGFDSTDTNWQLIRNDGAGAASKTDLGGSFPKANQTTLYRVSVFCRPNSSDIFVEFSNLGSGLTATSTLSADIPANTTFLQSQVYLNTGAAAVAVAVDVANQVITTQF